jgi:drug/metabolite transporter (DMT)-like permease
MFRVKSRFSFYILLHGIVFIFGFTGILGKLITLPSFDLVVYRMLLAAFALLIFVLVTRRKFRVEPIWIVKLILVGCIAGAHWLSFFHAIKISNVSVTLACISSSALFTALLEPLFFKKRLDISEILMGLAIIAGITIITNAQFEYINGIMLSLLAAFLGSLFGVLNGVFIKHKTSPVISFYELAGGGLVLLLALLFSGYPLISPTDISFENWSYLLLLALVATAFAFVASVFVMKELSPFTVALAINLEPVYAIIMAWMFFNEQMSSGFYIGSVIIIATLFANGYIKKQKVLSRARSHQAQLNQSMKEEPVQAVSQK